MGAKAAVPSSVGIELTDEIEQARGRGFQMCRQLGDLSSSRSIFAIART